MYSEFSSGNPRKRRRKDGALLRPEGSSGMDESDDSSTPESSSSGGSLRSERPYSVDTFRGSGTASSSRTRKWNRVESFSATPLSMRMSSEFKGSENALRIDSVPLTDDPDYRYETLAPGAIRILTVHPGAHESHLDCSLDIRMKGHHGKYEALSYVWGTDEPSFPVRIRRPDGGFNCFKITENLEAALRQLRHKSAPRRFWIDAICINQTSDEEKNFQVPMMSQIYGEASNVCVWIGKADEHGPRALALMAKVRFLRNYDRVVEDETRCKEWFALTKLMGQTWFSRRWVVQEIALARSATLHCGEYTIPWPHFAEAVTLFEEMAPRVRTKFRESKHYYQHPDFFGQVSAFSASKLVHVTNEVIRKSEDGRILVKQLSLEGLVSRLTSFEATRPHDIIYATLSLANDIPGSEPVVNIANPAARIWNPSTPQENGPDDSNMTTAQRRLATQVTNRLRVPKYPVDYGKNFFEICKDFLNFSISKSKSLDILCRPWAPVVKNEKLPSWIRTLRCAPYGRRPDGYWTRKNPDTLVGQPDKSSYSASGKYPCQWKFGEDSDSPSLRVNGFVLDIVDQVEDTARSGVIPKTWPRVCGWEDTEKDDPPECFWRTMVADRDANGQKASPLCLRSCATIFQERVEDGDLDTYQIRDRTQNTHIKAFAERLGAVVWNRRLTTTTTHRFVGLTPDETQRGDLICILPGCSVPVVLHPITYRKKRKNKNPRTNDGDRTEEKDVDRPIYTFVGECFIYGMMDGEGFTVRKEHERGMYETFEIH